MIRYLTAAIFAAGLLMIGVAGTIAARADVYRAVTSYEILTSSSAATSPEAVGGFINILRLMCDADCNVAFAASGTDIVSGTSAAMRLEANTPEYIRISPGVRIHVGAYTGEVTLYVSEVE